MKHPISVSTKPAAGQFEAIMLGVATRLDTSRTPIDVDKVRVAYDGLLANVIFQNASDRATADEESVRTRKQMAVAAFAEC